jgi:hypothetical protein
MHRGWLVTRRWRVERLGSNAAHTQDVLLKSGCAQRWRWLGWAPPDAKAPRRWWLTLCGYPGATGRFLPRGRLLADAVVRAMLVQSRSELNSCRIFARKYKLNLAQS